MRPFHHYQEVLKALEARGHRLRVLGYAPDRSPIVAVKTGGDKPPSILISSGSHATEQAGVAAAVELIDHLQSEHAITVVPTRDPIGLNGYRYALSLGLGEEPPVRSVAEAETLLRERGEVLYDRDGTLLVILGEYGYANRGLYGRFQKDEPFLEPVKGRRIFFPSRAEDQEGAAPLERAYTLIVSPEGEVLHLNRFHDTPWAPAEVRAVRRLMAEIRPGLTLDLHEYGGDAFWMSARHQRNEEDEQWEERMGREAVRAVAESGAGLAEEAYSPGTFFRKLERGIFWLEAAVRGEGLNLVDYAAHAYGPAFTIETGMRQPFEQRARAAMRAAQAAIAVFERRHA
jgi:hypothetical protein